MNSSTQTIPAGARFAVAAGRLEPLFRESALEIAVGAVMSAVVTAVLWTPDAGSFLLAWLGAMTVMYALRLGVGRAYQRSPSKAAHATAWSALFMLGVAGSSAAWGLLAMVMDVLMESQAMPYRQGYALSMTACMVVSMLAIYRGACLAVATSALAALLLPAAYFLIQPDELSRAAGGALALLAAVVIAAAVRLDKTLAGFFHLRDEHERLSVELDARKKELDKLEVTAKTSLARRKDLESALERTASELAAATHRSKALAESLVRVAPSCPITGLINRRRFLEILDGEWRRLMRASQPLSLMLFDLDDADQDAARYRTIAGSECLRRLAAVTRGFARRAGDTAIRYADTRFAILMPGADIINARRIAETLRRAIESQRISFPVPGAARAITVHVGVATLVPSPVTAPEELLGRVEDAMYQAGFQGGNRVVGYQNPETFGLVRWDHQADGAPSEQALFDKLSAWGYRPGTPRPGPDKMVERLLDAPSACAVVRGKLGLCIEGQAFELDAGDCLLLPQGKIYSTEVVGNDPVWLLEASRPA